MHVLVPLDDSEPARAALEHAVEEQPDAQITAVHVIDPSTAVYGEGGIYAYDALIESRREAAKTLLEDAEALAADHGVDLETETVVGQAAREIVEYTDENDVDRIIIGSRGRSGASRVLLGSVAENVARRAPVPVTIVR
ncbi:universal stress protein [Natrarchaeobaculum sulfurireducens]|uniref:Nucleotide-binding protein, UspA family n=1 Tax=Natrarchaeobaculum sulfurireducens TaxID=2044521 RepID=A0A346PIS3_9EURY|nr:universal stress protein [Natrarchaeobaculum sulfurireducens]AXR79418.1 Nucleotide-binding protein, UspA family [Natrarchaeobaculum sulfurireducens]